MKYFYTIFCIILISSVQAQSTRTVLLETSESNQVASSAKMLCIKKDLKNEFDENELAIISYHIDDFVNGGTLLTIKLPTDGRRFLVHLLAEAPLIVYPTMDKAS